MKISGVDGANQYLRTKGFVGLDCRKLPSDDQLVVFRKVSRPSLLRKPLSCGQIMRYLSGRDHSLLRIIGVLLLYPEFIGNRHDRLLMYFSSHELGDATH